MIFKSLSLFTNNIESQVHFYENVLGFSALSKSDTRVVFQIGASQLEFIYSEKEHIYHYCFLIPSNQLLNAVEWLKNRLAPIKVEGEEIIAVFDTWNAESVYFYDGSGNIAEFIVRHDLENDIEGDFGIEHILSINEMGLATNDIPKTFDKLNANLGLEIYRGNTHRFCAVGELTGLFIIPNYTVKESWFPTDIKIIPENFHAVLENKNQLVHVKYQEEVLSIDEG